MSVPVSVPPTAGAFGDHHQGAVVAAAFAVEHGFGDAFMGEGDFRDQDDVGAAGDAAVERDPAGVAAHDLQHHDALVAVGGGVQPVEGVHHRGDGRIEAEGHGRGLKVVVDGLGHADDRDAVAFEFAGRWSASRRRRPR